MKRVAIVGGGIAGLAAAYELEQQRKAGAAVEWELFEATDRLGGILETTRRDGFVLEGGPDGWVTEKPWARELAVELGLESELIACHETTKKTYILIGGKLLPMPQRMRMMVPEDLAALHGSPLFSETAQAAYANELARADGLKRSAPAQDESVASFVLRHFGDEVLEKIGAPLLSGVFGGDVAKLSVRAVMPAFVKMEQEHGSLIAALQARAKERGGRVPQPTFTSLRRGLGSLVEALVATLPEGRIHLRTKVTSLTQVAGHVLLAAPVDAARRLLERADEQAAALIPSEASSAVLATFAWEKMHAEQFNIPDGFGFLAPKGSMEAKLLACTFVDQKFPDRAPEGSRVMRAFFGGANAEAMMQQSEATVAAAALDELARILTGPADRLPVPVICEVRRWPRSLPQYEVGHLERMAELDERIGKLGGLTLLGNGYRGVGVPDLIRDARNAARAIAM